MQRTIQIAGERLSQRAGIAARRRSMAASAAARARYPSAPPPPAPPTISIGGTTVPPRPFRMRLASLPRHGPFQGRNVAISAHAASWRDHDGHQFGRWTSQEAYAGQGAYDQYAFRDSCSDDDLAFALCLLCAGRFRACTNVGDLAGQAVVTEYRRPFRVVFNQCSTPAILADRRPDARTTCRERRSLVSPTLHVALVEGPRRVVPPSSSASRPLREADASRFSGGPQGPGGLATYEDALDAVAGFHCDDAEPEPRIRWAISEPTRVAPVTTSS